MLHVASPIGTGVPRSQVESLVRPARDGTLRVLKAAVAAGVRRVVLTSSMAAVVEGYKDPRRHFDEKDWTQLDGNPRPYAVSKTLAEHAAWDFFNNLGTGNPMELAVINPANVLGPILGPRQTTSTELVIRMMRPAYPGWPRFHTILVGVRDVASAHLLAMTSPATAGERFCCFSSILWMDEMARILNQHFSSRAQWRVRSLTQLKA